jgi:hypothetical protein
VDARLPLGVAPHECRALAGLQSLRQAELAVTLMPQRSCSVAATGKWRGVNGEAGEALVRRATQPTKIRL